MHYHHPQAALAGLAACAVLLAPVGPAAGAAPDIRGTWHLQGAVVVTGAGQHYPAEGPASAEGAAPRLRPFDGTLQIVGQEGDRFWGTVASANYREDLVGIFTGEGEGRKFLYVDTDGFGEGSVTSAGTLRVCYRHINPTSRLAGCSTATRE
jgi:hypothetical protein